MSELKRIGVLTSGGDSPGMNACIRAVVKAGIGKGIQVFGIEDGYKGMIEDRIRELTYTDVNNIIHLGGTILGTARSEEFKLKEWREKAVANLRKLQIEALILIGGDGTFAGGMTLTNEFDIPIIGIPGTIDNDIHGTEFTIGYDTCLNTVVEAVDKIRDTASSHHRVFFIEVMGRASGYIALNTAIASGAESVLIPETVTDIPLLADQIRNQNKGIRSSIIIVAEGDEEGGAKEIMKKVKPYLETYDLKCSILGHIQRGGSPSAFDRILATRMGVKAVELLFEGKKSMMIGQIGRDLVFHNILEGTTDHVSKDDSGIGLLKLLLTKG
ncbi:6-phosphofructokinase [Fluviicola taffensis]|uniref:ATP-dependent 6-phosphofructokinase n=1 Tax=Fluviicola taffensis (strain DSM 16823 / NCIMB 13979 / RW262) TaxID=755732 RepID=F2IDT8_FLUTR|nr:6-phosphofructokinase [Fluviicola taffensis]AEA44480.1 6-phosphofructokinase [Fluviicola taffensis DSM 16823]